jgi:hypothetical protein
MAVKMLEKMRGKVPGGLWQNIRKIYPTRISRSGTDLSAPDGVL